MERLTDNEPLREYETDQVYIHDIYNGLQAYEQAKEQGLLLRCPVKVGSEVYVICECENIPTQLDGTYETATGYYCPYEDSCPHIDYSDDCDKCKTISAVFEDTVGSIYINECGMLISTDNCQVMSELGDYIFLTSEEAEAKLAELRGAE